MEINCQRRDCEPRIPLFGPLTASSSVIGHHQEDDKNIAHRLLRHRAYDPRIYYHALEQVFG
jgi:hypothetical protein